MSLLISKIGFLTTISILVCLDSRRVLQLLVVLNLYAPMLASPMIKILAGLEWAGLVRALFQQLGGS